MNPILWDSTRPIIYHTDPKTQNLISKESNVPALETNYLRDSIRPYGITVF